MTKASSADQAIERGSQGLHRLAQRAADRGGLAAKLAQPLEEDSQFVRKLKPSLIAARVRGDAPTREQSPTVEAPVPRHPSADDGDPNPFVVVGAAAAAGVAFAKLIDWRGHAHPRSSLASGRVRLRVGRLALIDRR
jgi:hypothetical protein